VYDASKSHSVTYRGNLNDSFLEFADDIIDLAQDFEVCFRNRIEIRDSFTVIIGTIKLLFPKLYNYTDYHDSRSAVEGIVESLSFSLSSLILKAGRIVDTLGETDKSIQYGDVHVTRVHRQAGGLLKTTAFEVCTPYYSYVISNAYC
jgi:hypothetical protein